MYDYAHKDTIVEETDVVQFLKTLGVTKEVFPTLSCFTVNSFVTLVVRITYSSLCLVHHIPLKRKNKPGVHADSWLNRLSAEEKKIVNKHMNQFNNPKFAKKIRNYTTVLEESSLQKPQVPVIMNPEVVPQVKSPDHDSKSFRLHGFTVKLSKTRCLDWRNSFLAQLETMSATVFDASLPESFKELGGHYLLASLETNRDAALVEVYLPYIEILNVLWLNHNLILIGMI